MSTKVMFVSAAIASLLMAGCASMAKNEGSEAILFNPSVTSQALEVSVISNGCTKAEHFYLKVHDDQVELRRTQADKCRAAPSLVRLSFEYSFSDGVYQFKNEVRYSNRIVR